VHEDLDALLASLVVVQVHAVLDDPEQLLWLVVEVQVSVLHLGVVQDVTDHDDHIFGALFAAVQHLLHVRLESVGGQLRLEQLEEELNTTDGVSQVVDDARNVVVVVFDGLV